MNMRTLAGLPAALLGLAPVAFGQFLVRPYSQTNEPLEQRVLADFDLRPRQGAALPSFLHYEVPAMSDRQRLEDVYPDDGEPGGTVTIVAAKGEYEPASFLVYPLADLGKVKFEVGELRREEGKGKREEGGDVVFPKENLDLKVVKVWYQNGNAWYSYFGDSGAKLCPELLLNDEDLIRVDTAKKANYARLVAADGTVREHWLNSPYQMDRMYHDSSNPCGIFKPMAPGFADAKTLQPVTLEKGRFRNFFLTAHVTKDIPAGLYRGEVKVRGEGGQRLGAIPVAIRVLDFELPAPKRYLDPELDFYVSSYAYLSIECVMEWNGGDEALARRQLPEIFRNMVRHGQTILKNRARDLSESEELFKAAKEAGMRTDVLVGGLSVERPQDAESELPDIRLRARRAAKYFDERYGHHNVYICYGDEPGVPWLMANRPLFSAYRDAGFQFLIAGSDNVFSKAGYLYGWHNIAKEATDDSSLRLWNQLATKPLVAWYSYHHVGPENPAFNRRQYGMAAYLSGYSAVCNYAHHLGPYNDNSTQYRPMMFFYGTHDGVIDTIQWEGFREAIDDIRYATLMCRLAREAAATGVAANEAAANRAFTYLAKFKKDSDDLNACRMEMIEHIEALGKLVKKEGR